MHLTGFHHLTAVTADARQNHRFYTEVTGLRLVKRTVNQDDVSAYHLFYADGAGSPGTDLTFFEWDLPPEQRGTHSVTRTSLRVHGEGALRYWHERLAEHGADVSDVVELDGRLTSFFEDPEGQRLALVDDGGGGDDPVVWDQSPVPVEFQIRGLGPIVMSVPRLDPTDSVLTDVMGFRRLRHYPHPHHPGHLVHIYEMGDGGAHAELHVAEQPDLPFAQLGAGGVHHVAFRTPDDDQYRAWNERLDEAGIRNSGPVDRFYFKSLYFREPNGILFEIATDGPGFAADEDADALGERLALPPFLEPRREQIAAELHPID